MKDVYINDVEASVVDKKRLELLKLSEDGEIEQSVKCLEKRHLIN